MSMYFLLTPLIVCSKTFKSRRKQSPNQYKRGGVCLEMLGTE